MMANDLQENNYDVILENAQRTVFLKELFSQVNLFGNSKKRKFGLFVALSRSIGYYEYYSTDCYEKFNSMLGKLVTKEIFSLWRLPKYKEDYVYIESKQTGSFLITNKDL
jgi:hypothetical protein